VGFPSQWGKKSDTPTYTSIDLGSHYYQVKAKAWQLGLIFGSVMAFLSWLALSAWDAFWERTAPTRTPKDLV
jgi:hypothetical protein